MKRQMACLWIAAVLTSCASTHPGISATSISNNSNLPLKISAENVDEPSGTAFQLISFTFENLSDRWVRINSVKVLTDESSRMSVVTGNDLKDWGKAMSFKLKKDEHNDSMAQTSLLLAGAAAMSAGSGSDNSNLATAGAIAMIGSSAWVVGDVIKASLVAATQAETLPDNHVSHPFSVPGKLFIRRWVLLNKPSDSVVRKVAIDVETIGGERDTYEVAL
jgi:hypothetical protein